MTGNRSWIVLAIAAILGIAAVIIANSYLTGAEQQSAQEVEDNRRVQVAVARVPLNYGDVITLDKLRMVAWPANSVPNGAFRSTDDLAKAGAEQRVALRSIEVGEPVLASKISGAGGRATISAVLPDDKRAVAVRINDVAGVAGFVLPGDSVDVMVTRDLPDETGLSRPEKITDVLVQNVRVIAVDQNANDNANEPALAKTVTLEVEPVQAQKLALGGQVGILSLSLRNVADQDPTMLATVNLDDLRADAVPTGWRRPTRSYAASYTQSAEPVYVAPARVVRRAAPKPVAKKSGRNTTVQVGRGSEVSNMEVQRHAGY